MSRTAVPGFIDYPSPKQLEVPYKAPPPPSNPIFRGLPLYYGAQIVASFSFLQTYLWNNAGFSSLRELKQLEHVENRYDPTVIPIEGANNTPSKIYTDPTRVRNVKQAVGSFRFYSVVDFHNAYKAGTLTPNDVVESLLPLIRRDVVEPTKHATAFLETKIDVVTKAAEAATRRWKEGRPLGVLDGVPIAVKDEMDLKGYGKCCGTLRDLKSKEDETSWCVTKLEEEGAVVLGKLNMHELGLDTTNNNPNYGTPLNPYTEHYYTGGSSGGAAYAVSAGIIPFAIGTDGGGSIRIPANFCGIYGLKPSHGRVSCSPTPSLDTSTVVIGPLASNMADLEVSYHVMAKPDPSNPVSSLFPSPKRQIGERQKVIGIYKTWFHRADPPVRAACERALDYFTSKFGYEIVDITIPYIHEGQLAHAITILSECAAAHPDPTGLTASNKVLISVAANAPARDLMLAQKMRNVIMQHLAHLFQKHPGLIIVTPTTPQPGWHIKGGKADLKYGCSDGNMTFRNMEYVWLANLTGLPCIQFPVGYVDPAEGIGKIPIGLSGNGEWGSEDALIEFGYAGEAYMNSEPRGGRRKPETWVDVLHLKTEQET